MKPVSIYPTGENAATISFGDEISIKTNDCVFRLYRHLQDNQKKFWYDLIPAYTTLTILYDAPSIRRHHLSAFDWVRKALEVALDECDDSISLTGRSLQVPVCYDSEFAPDMKQMVVKKKLSPEKIIELHTSTMYRVFMLGFLPGFAYMGIVSDELAVPRLKVPRNHVPAGSVGIAGNQTGIYPLESPGGWNIIGRTPLLLFDATQEQPALLQPGDEVKFVSITKEEFEAFNQHKYKLLYDEF